MFLFLPIHILCVRNLSLLNETQFVGRTYAEGMNVPCDFSGVSARVFNLRVFDGKFES